jgi:hypothetical protein
LPHLNAVWESRKKRQLPESIQYAQSKFAKIWAIDCSVLEALFGKLKSLEDIPKGKLGGKIIKRKLDCRERRLHWRAA